MHRTKLWSAAAVVSAMSIPLGGEAAVTILGAGFARQCYEYAEAGRASELGLENCSRALVEQALPARERAATHVNRGILRMHAKDIARALADYDAALRLKPDLAEAHVNRGIALVNAGGREAEAIAALSQGLKLETTRPEVAYYTRGVAHELAGNVRAAYDDYRQAAALKPDWTEPRTQLQRFKRVGAAGG